MTHKLHLYSILPRRGPLRHLGKLGCVRSDPYEPTSTGIGVGRGGAATHLYATDLYSDLLDRSYSILGLLGFDLVRIARCRWFDSVIFTLCTSVRLALDRSNLYRHDSHAC